jgi:hypothetical protein
MRRFATWAARRLFGVINSGVGLASTLITIALFVVPSFLGAVSRWWALVPLVVYVIGALLYDEYKRVSSPCLNATMEEEVEVGMRGQPRRQNFIRIENCGPIPIENVACDLSEKSWKLLTDSMVYPIPVIEPNESTRLMLVTSMGSSIHAYATLRGEIDGKPYERKKLLSLFDK